jgi:hypothetical protein
MGVRPTHTDSVAAPPGLLPQVVQFPLYPPPLVPVGERAGVFFLVRRGAGLAAEPGVEARPPPRAGGDGGRSDGGAGGGSGHGAISMGVNSAGAAVTDAGTP